MPQTPSRNINRIKKNQSIDPKFEEVVSKMVKRELTNYPIYSGINNESTSEIKTIYQQTSNETLINSKTNCFIILGSDRPAAQGSGYGGRGQTGAAAIDIVAGHLGTRPINNINGVPVPSSKSFESDAARIYISQMCDLDDKDYLNIPKRPIQLGSISLDLEQSVARSGIGLKADVIRIVGRENIKIVTNHVGTNSQDFSIDAGGIDLIAGCERNDAKHSLQPMVKGDNLIEALKAIIKLIEDVQTNVHNFLQRQNAINEIILNHRHQVYDTVTKGMVTVGKKDNDSIANFSSMLTSDKEETFFTSMEQAMASLVGKSLTEVILNNVSFGTTVNDYFSLDSPKYINSRFNRVN